MTLMWIVGGLVLGLMVFLMIRRKVNKAEKREQFKGVNLLCPRCGKVFDASAGWVRSGLRGDLFEDSNCGRRTWFKSVKAAGGPLV